MQDQTLKDDLPRYVRQNWKTSEILESKYPRYTFSEQTLARRLHVHELWSDIENLKEAVRCEMELVSYLIYKVQITFQQGCEQWKTPTD